MPDTYDILRDPGMLNTQRVEAAIWRGVGAAWAEMFPPPELIGNAQLPKLRCRLAPILTKYIAEKRFYERASPHVYRRKFNQLTADGERLLKHLEQLRAFSDWGR